MRLIAVYGVLPVVRRLLAELDQARRDLAAARAGWAYARDDEPETPPLPPEVEGWDPHGWTGPARTAQPYTVAPPVDMAGWPSYRTDQPGGVR